MQSCPGAGCQSVCHFGRSGLHARHHAITRTPRLSYSPIPPGNHVRRQMCQVDGDNATSRRIPGAIVDKIDALALCAMSENADAVVRGWAFSREFAFASDGQRYLHHFAWFNISVTELTAWGLTSGREEGNRNMWKYIKCLVQRDSSTQELLLPARQARLGKIVIIKGPDESALWKVVKLQTPQGEEEPQS